MLLKKLKRLKQYEKSMGIANEMLELQGRDGNYNYDEYMLGLYNGMEYIVSLLEVREPKFINGKEVKFLSEKKTKKKKFVEYMNKTIEELECDDVDDEEMKAYLIQRINTFKEILQKYKSIIGVSDDKK